MGAGGEQAVPHKVHFAGACEKVAADAEAAPSPHLAEAWITPGTEQQREQTAPPPADQLHKQLQVTVTTILCFGLGTFLVSWADKTGKQDWSATVLSAMAGRVAGSSALCVWLRTPVLAQSRQVAATSRTGVALGIVGPLVFVSSYLFYSALLVAGADIAVVLPASQLNIVITSFIGELPPQLSRISIEMAGLSTENSTQNAAISIEIRSIAILLSLAWSRESPDPSSLMLTTGICVMGERASVSLAVGTFMMLAGAFLLSSQVATTLTPSDGSASSDSLDDGASSISTAVFVLLLLGMCLSQGCGCAMYAVSSQRCGDWKVTLSANGTGYCKLQYINANCFWNFMLKCRDNGELLLKDDDFLLKNGRSFSNSRYAVGLLFAAATRLAVCASPASCEPFVVAPALITSSGHIILTAGAASYVVLTNTGRMALFTTLVT